jgi:hypothetical protein
LLHIAFASFTARHDKITRTGLDFLTANNDEEEMKARYQRGLLLHIASSVQKERHGKFFRT